MAPKTSDLFRNRYRVPSARMRGWDYGGGGAYFVTICARNRTCYFGEIVDGRFSPSPLGEIVAEEWQETSKVRLYVDLDS